jgi:hypothetical protein
MNAIVGGSGDAPKAAASFGRAGAEDVAGKGGGAGGGT